MRDFGLLTRTERSEWIAKYAKSGKVPIPDVAAVERHPWLITTCKKKGDESFFYGKSLLATYYDSSWVFKCDTERVKTMSVDDVVVLVKGTKEFLDCMAELTPQIDEMIRRADTEQWSWSFELCPRSLSKQGAVRGHLHVALSWPAKRHIRSEKALMVGGAVPSHARIDQMRISSRAKSPNAAHFYLQVEKFGTLRQECNYSKYVDYQVNPRWVGCWLQARKLSFDVAERELISCSAGVSNHLKDLRSVQAEHKKLLCCTLLGWNGLANVWLKTNPEQMRATRQ
jgi:hypothetical protein